MCAHALLNLLNELRKSEACPAFYLFFTAKYGSTNVRFY